MGRHAQIAFDGADADAEFGGDLALRNALHPGAAEDFIKALVSDMG